MAKAAKATSKAKAKANSKARAAPKRPPKPYPAVTLESALEIPYSIKEKNGGNPWATEDVASAVGYSAKGNDFFYLTAGARDYGLTEGTRNTTQISLTELGREIAYASSPEEELRLKRKAFLNIEIFRKVLDHYQGSDLPEMKYLGNTLEREFNLHSEYHEEFSRIFRENARYLGITSGIEGAEEDQSDTRQEKHKATVTIGEPKTKSKLTAFVIMPFTERHGNRPEGFFSEVLRSLITPAGVEAGFRVETANRQGSDLIQSTIINDLLDADLVIADLTDHNPNVLFELGIRMAEDKPVAIVKATGTGRIFDVDNMLRVYEYSENLWRTTIETDLPELTNHIKAAWETRATGRSYMKILRDPAGTAAD